MHYTLFRLVMACLVFGLAPGALGAQAPAAGAQPPRLPAVVSPEVSRDGRVVFRILAPNATSVTLNAGDIPATALVNTNAVPPAPAATTGASAPATGAPAIPSFTKNENGVWEATVGPVPPGAFRYVFLVDGVRTIDPVNTRISESNTATWSVFDVPGLAVQEPGDGPHGAVATVFYPSSVLKRTRRMHIYTPPGYETGARKYPVFYLLHGSGDTDDAWTSVGRAGFIFDNLIANGKVPPMIVVMPAGHQSTLAPPAAASAGSTAPQPPPAVNPFTLEFVTDVMPYVERQYRTMPDRAHRAIAGLSMGGSQTLDISFRHLDRFAYIGVFSSGAVLGGPRPGAPATTPAPPRPDWEATHLANLDNAALKKGTKVLWLSTGVDDRLMPNTRATVDLLRKHGFTPVFTESTGGHTWINWRDYLIEFTVQLFR